MKAFKINIKHIVGLLFVLFVLMVITGMVKIFNSSKTSEVVSEIEETYERYISTVAGTGKKGYSNDGTLPLDTHLNNPRGTYIDKADNLYIADTGNHRIRMIPKEDGTYFGVNMIKGNIYTIAGNGLQTKDQEGGYGGDTKKAIDVKLNMPQNVAVDENNNLYIADSENKRIQKVDNQGIITTVVGTGEKANEIDKTSEEALKISLGRVNSIAVDNQNNLYIGESLANGDSYIRQVDLNSWKTNTITSDNEEKRITYGDGRKIEDTKMGNVKQIIFDKENNMYVSEGNVVFMIPVKEGVNFNIPMEVGKIYFIAGRYNASAYQGDGVTGTGVKLNEPWGIAVDSIGNLYLADRDNFIVRFVDKNSGMVSNIVGDGVKGNPENENLAQKSRIGWINNIGIDSNDKLYLPDYDNNSIYSVEDRENSRIPPSLEQNFNKNTVNQQVEFKFKDDEDWRKSISKIIVNDEEIKKQYSIKEGEIIIKKDVFKESGIYKIKVKAKGYKDTLMIKRINDLAKKLKSDNTNNNAGFEIEITYDDDDDWRQGVISYSREQGVYIDNKRIDAESKYYFEQGKLILDRSVLTKPGTYNIKVSSLGYEDSIVTQKILEGEKPSHSEVTLDKLKVFAGTGESEYFGEGVVPAQAKLSVSKVYLDESENVFLSDTKNQRIRMIPKENGTYYGIHMERGKIYTVAGDGTKESSDFGSHGGDGGKAIQAKLNNPRNVVVDKRGNLYIADYANQSIRKVDTKGIITTVVGTKGKAPRRSGDGLDGENLQGDGGQAKDALIRGVFDMYIDNDADKLYFAQLLRVREIDLQTGIINTVTGAKGGGGYIQGAREAIGDGDSAEEAEFNQIKGMIFDKDKNLYIVNSQQIRIVPNESGTYFGIDMKGGNIYTLSGHYSISDSFGDGYSANNARFEFPLDVETDSKGNIYVLDSGNNTIRFISKESGNIYTVLGEKDGDFKHISGIRIDRNDNLYIADLEGNKVYHTRVLYKE